jgi:hypothetical protein
MFLRDAEAETLVWQKEIDAVFIPWLISQMHSMKGSRMSLGQKQDISQMFALFCSHERSDCDHHMTDKAHSQATIDRLEGQLRELKRKVGLYKAHPKVPQLEIAPT